MKPLREHFEVETDAGTTLRTFDYIEALEKYISGIPSASPRIETEKPYSETEDKFSCNWPNCKCEHCAIPFNCETRVSYIADLQKQLAETEAAAQEINRQHQEEYKLLKEVMKERDELNQTIEALKYAYEKDRDSFAIGFGEWMSANGWRVWDMTNDGSERTWRQITESQEIFYKTTAELLEPYKQSFKL